MTPGHAQSPATILPSLRVLTAGQRAMVAVILVMTLGAAVASWWQIADADRQEQNGRFERALDDWRTQLQSRLQERLAIMQGAAGFWRTMPEATGEDWRSYLDGVRLDDRFPDIDAITFTRYVRPEQMAAFLSEAENRVKPGFRIFPDPGASDAFVITHAEPIERVRSIIGFNVGHEARRRHAAEQARDTGQPAMTLPLALITDGQTAMDLIIFAPVYRRFFPVETTEQRRRALRGWVSMGVHVSAMLRALDQQTQSSGLQVSVSHLAEDGPRPLLIPTIVPRDDAPPFTGVRYLEVAGQTWMISARPSPSTPMGQRTDHLSTLLALVSLALALSAGVALLFVSRQQKTLLADSALTRLNDTERRLASIVSASPAVIYALGPAPDYHLRFLSRSIPGLAEAATGGIFPLTSWHDLIHTQDKAALDEALSALTPGTAGEAIYRVRGTRTGWRWLLDRFVLVQDDTGRVSEILGALIDITDRRQAEDALAQSEARYRAIVNGTAEGYWRIEPVTGLTLEVNESLCAMLGYNEADILGRPPIEFADSAGAAIMRDQMARIDETNHRLYDTTLRRKDGSIIIVHFSATTLRDAEGRASAVFAFITDVTERRRLETELLDKTAAFQASNANLQQFAYVASHDLQAPLRTISSFLQLLQRRHGGDLDPAAQDYIRFAVEGAKHMSLLVQNLLLFSRVESLGQPLEPTDLRHCVETALRNLIATIEATGAVVDVDDACPWVMGDGSQLISVVQNLVENALKYRRPDVTPDIVIGMAASGDTVTLSVSDNGIGIAPEHHARIFRIFQRLHTAADYEGTGIGLALCQRVAERHGTRIQVQSHDGPGVTFSLTLKAAREPSVYWDEISTGAGVAMDA